MIKKIILVLTIFLVSLAIYINFPQIMSSLTFESIIESKDKWKYIAAQGATRSYIVFFVANVIVASLPIPGVSVLSFLGGLLFGFQYGFLLSSVATALGNLLAFFLARYLFQDFVQKKYNDKIAVFKNDWEKNGALALLSMRLFPLIPSFVANLIMGVSPLRWWTFFWVGWFGRLPMVMIYTKAGTEVDKIQSYSDIVSLNLVVILGLMALMPWTFKFIHKKITKAL